METSPGTRSLPVARGWHEVAPDDEATWTSLGDGLTFELGPRGVDPARIYSELGRAREHARFAPARRWFVVTSENLESAVPVVAAVGWFVLESGPRPVALDDTSGSMQDGVLTIELRRLGDDTTETVLRHDLVVDGGSRIYERLVVLGADAASGTRLALEVSTSDLAAFQDVVGDAVQFLALVGWSTA